MKIIYNLVGDSGMFVSSPPTLLSDKDTIEVRFIGAPQSSTAVIKMGSSSSYIDIVDENIVIPRDAITKVVGQGLFSMFISVITSERPLRRWTCESLGLVKVGDKTLVFPNYEETREKLAELASTVQAISDKLFMIEKKMNAVDEKVSEFVGGDITE